MKLTRQLAVTAGESQDRQKARRFVASERANVSTCNVDRIGAVLGNYLTVDALAVVSFESFDCSAVTSARRSLIMRISQLLSPDPPSLCANVTWNNCLRQFSV